MANTARQNLVESLAARIRREFSDTNDIGRTLAEIIDSGFWTDQHEYLTELFVARYGNPENVSTRTWKRLVNDVAKEVA